MISRATAAGALPAGRPPLEAVRIPVAGMTCASCVGSITRALRRVHGVERIRVELGAETVTVERMRDSAPDAAIAAAISRAGYDPDISSAHVVPAHASRGLLDRWLRRTS